MDEQKVTVSAYVAECEVVLAQIEPELEYRRADLYGFVSGCWPTDDTPADVAADFAATLRAEAEE